MSRKIIKPVGEELLSYLNNDTAICNECGAVMDYVEDATGGVNDIYVCPSCGWKIAVEDYAYEYDDSDWTDEMLNDFADDVPPAGCRACGGPYPSCMMSCKLFDD